MLLSAIFCYFGVVSHTIYVIFFFTIFSVRTPFFFVLLFGISTQRMASISFSLTHSLFFFFELITIENPFWSEENKTTTFFLNSPSPSPSSSPFPLYPVLAVLIEGKQTRLKKRQKRACSLSTQLTTTTSV